MDQLVQLLNYHRYKSKSQCLCLSTTKLLKFLDNLSNSLCLFVYKFGCSCVSYHLTLRLFMWVYICVCIINCLLMKFACSVFRLCQSSEPWAGRRMCSVSESGQLRPWAVPEVQRVSIIYQLPNVLLIFGTICFIVVVLCSCPVRILALEHRTNWSLIAEMLGGQKGVGPYSNVPMITQSWQWW